MWHFPALTQRRRALGPAGPPKPRLILDIDWGQDSDDAAALALAMHNDMIGRLVLLGVVNTIDFPQSTSGLRGLINAYGRSDLPVYASHATTEIADGIDRFSVEVRAKYGDVNKVNTDFPTALTGYRTMLASAPDASVRICVVGGLLSLYQLMISEADGISPLTGMELIAAKVTDFYRMGLYPNNASPEYNTSRSPAASAYVHENWPGTINVVDIDEQHPRVGANWFADPDDPFRFVDITYHGNDWAKRNGWDPLTLAACLRDLLGIDSNFRAKFTGVATTINPSTGANTPVSGTTGNINFWDPATNGDPFIGNEIQKAYEYFELNKPKKASGKFFFPLNEGSGVNLTDEFDPTLKAFLGTSRSGTGTYAPTWDATGKWLDIASSKFVGVPVDETFCGANLVMGILVNFNVTTGNQVIHSMGYAANNDTGWSSTLNGTTFNFNIQRLLAANLQATAASGVTAGNWYRIIFSVTNGNEVRMYRDGVQVGSTYNSAAPLDSVYILDNPITIGAGKAGLGGAPVAPMNGKVAAFGVTASLAPAAVAAEVAAMDAKLAAILSAKALA
jgi:hypothetical protein